MIISCSFFSFKQEISFFKTNNLLYSLIIVSSPWYLFELVTKGLGLWLIRPISVRTFFHPVAGHKQPYITIFGGVNWLYPFSFLGLRNALKDSGSEIIFEN